jgi:ATP-dependent RNA helicase RhlE
MALLPATAKRQNLLFSATFSGEIKKLADQLLNAPQLIEVARRNTAAETVSLSAYRVPSDAKRALLEHLVRSRGLSQVLCFVRTKHGASRLARQLAKDGLVTDAIHGDKTQQTRMQALAAFKEGKLEVLVATDVAARGLDIDDLPVVVNYELPHVPEDYIHRIGRTGRAGATGEAISFVAPEEEKYLADIERLLKKKIEIASVAGLDLSAARTSSHSAHSAHSAHPGSAHRSSRAPRDKAASANARRTASGTPASDRSADSRGSRPPRDESRAPRSSHDDSRAAPPSRVHSRAERDRAYALNPDQPRPSSRAAHPPSDPASTKAATLPKRHGFGHGRPVPALLKKRVTEKA